MASRRSLSAQQLEVMPAQAGIQWKNKRSKSAHKRQSILLESLWRMAPLRGLSALQKLIAER